jgi:hypothetical protein
MGTVPSGDSPRGTLASDGSSSFYSERSPLMRDETSLRTFVSHAVCVLLCAVSLSADASSSRLDMYVDALTSTLSARERNTLQQIPELDRRLLALRAYVRAGANLDSRWSWTQAEIERYTASEEYQRLLADIERVQRAFERSNPGYTLYANRDVRSLDTQIERWNSNRGVKTTARNLQALVMLKLTELPDQPNALGLEMFRELLSSWRPTPVSPLAAPGLSLHGRMRAIDFQIMRNGQVVAATDVGAVAREWQATGWSRKLKQAIVASGSRFEGPLASPNEPWHYEYRDTSGGK